MPDDSETKRSVPTRAEELLERYAQGERDFRGSVIHDADLGGAALPRVDLSDSDFSGCDLSGADLRMSTLDHFRVRRASLHGAKLLGTDLNYAYLSDADFSEPSRVEPDLRIVSDP